MILRTLTLFGHSFWLSEFFLLFPLSVMYQGWCFIIVTALKIKIWWQHSLFLRSVDLVKQHLTLYFSEGNKLTLLLFASGNSSFLQLNIYLLSEDWIWQLNRMHPVMMMLVFCFEKPVVDEQDWMILPTPLTWLTRRVPGSGRALIIIVRGISAVVWWWYFGPGIGLTTIL